MSEPGRREVAHRLFAAEFDDVELSYSEGNEERAPNYVVTPTGARINRLFTVAVLTEVESVNENMLRARIVDPSGAFVTYAGQYQPDERAFLDRADPPTFVGLTGKARTFEPDDADRIYSSVRPESVNEVDGETRDRWIVGAAETTLTRLAVFEQALESDLGGDDLRTALAAGGAPAHLADGIPRALNEYDTTSAYVEAIRRLAVDALETVAGERAEVRPLDIAPDDVEEVNIGPLPATDVTVDTGAIDRMHTPEADTGTSVDTAGESKMAADAGATGSDAEMATGEAELSSLESDSEPSTEVAAAPGSKPHDAGESSAVSAQDSPGESTDESSPDIPSETPIDESVPELRSESVDDTADEATGETESGDGELGAFDDESGLGDFDDEMSGADSNPDSESTGFDPNSEAVSPSPTDRADLNDSDTGVDTASEVDGEMYDLDEAERQEIEEEFDTGFSTGTEVDDAGEAGIDVPGPEELAEQSESEASSAQHSGETGPSETVTDPADSSAASEATDRESSDDQPDATTASGGDPEESSLDTTPSESPTNGDSQKESTDTDTDTDTDSYSSEQNLDDGDLEDAVVELMSEFDTGGGASREDIISAAADRYGADSGPIEEAIEDALMSGKCYESGEDTLKPI